MKKSVRVWRKRIIWGITITLLLFLAFFIANAQGYDTESIYNEEEATIFASIWKEESLSQSFTSNVNNINKIEIKMSSINDDLESKSLGVAILDENNNIVRETIITTDILSSTQDIEFNFKPIFNSYKEYYTITLSCYDCTSNENIGVYGLASEKDEYSASINNVKQSYSTSFKVVGKNYYNEAIKWCSIIIFILTFCLFATNMSIIKNKFHKILKYFDKNIIFFIIEFILSLIWVILLFNIIYQFNYNFVFAKFPYILFFLLSELLVFMFAYKLNKNIKPEEFFLLLAIPIGLCFLLFLFPTEVADENIHYASVYNFSLGKFIYNKNYAYIPEIIASKGHPYTLNYKSLVELLKTPVNSNTTKFIISCYNFIGYIPAIIGVFIGNILNLPYFLGFYLGRLLTFICVLIFTYITIKTIPIGKMLLAIYCLSPMFLHQAASISLDAMLNVYCLLLISYTLYLSHNKKQLTKKNKIILFILMLFIACLKYAYLPLILIVLILLFKKEMTKKDKITIIIFTLISIIVDLISFAIYELTPKDIVLDYVANNDINIINQLMYLIHNPKEILNIFINTMNENALDYWESFIGMSLGWLNIIVDSIFGYIYTILLFISPFLLKEKENYTKKEKIVLILISLIEFIAILFVLYLIWTNVGDNVISGVQGRYFIPIFILALLTLCDKERYLKFKNPYLISTAILLFVQYNAIATVIAYFL